MADFLYSKEHLWVLKEGNNIVKTGITDVVKKNIGDILFIELPEKDKIVNAQDVLCSIDSAKSVFELAAPVSGKIVEVNTILDKKTKLLNTAPFTEGWICCIEMSKPEELDILLSEDDYKKHVEATVES